MVSEELARLFAENKEYMSQSPISGRWFLSPPALGAGFHYRRHKALLAGDGF